MDRKTKRTIPFLSLGLQKFSHFGTLVEILGCSLLLSYLCNPPCSIFFFFILTIPSMNISQVWKSVKTAHRLSQNTTTCWNFSSLCCYSVAQSCVSLWYPELQHARLPSPSLSPRVCSNSYVHQVDDAIQPSHPLSPTFLPALNLSQGLFQWVGSLHQVAKVLELQLQLFQWIMQTC